jgi:excisionase family DNA binding protein
MAGGRSMKIGAVQKNSQEEIRVNIQNYQGTDIIDLRTYWQNAEGEWIPTKKGISLTYHVVENVIKLLQKAFKKMPEPVGLSDYLKLSESTINKMVSNKQIPHFKIQPGQSGGVRFFKKDIDKWISRQTIPEINPFKSKLKIKAVS